MQHERYLVQLERRNIRKSIIYPMCAEMVWLIILSICFFSLNKNKEDYIEEKYKTFFIEQLITMATFLAIRIVLCISAPCQNV